MPSNFEKLKILLNNLEEINKYPDIILICETWKQEKKHDMFRLPGYNFIEVHRMTKKGGGVGIFINEELNYYRRNDLAVFEEGTVESLFIEITAPFFSKSYIIGEMYRIPGTNEKHFIDKYENILQQLKQESKNLIIGMDQKHRLAEI